MKTNAYKVVVSIKDTETMNSSDDVVNIDAFTAMEAHREVQDKIDWRLQEITEVFLVKDKVDNGGMLVYSIEDGFIEE